MPRTFTIDNVRLLRAQAYEEESTGAIRVFAEYELRAGVTPVQVVNRDLTTALSPARRAAVVALLQGLAQDAAAAEQL